MKNLRFFIWVIVPVGLYLTYLIFGLPHFIWSYSYRQTGPASLSNPFVGRTYDRCTFIGPYGAFTTYPRDGKCGWIVFRKTRSANTGGGN